MERNMQLNSRMISAPGLSNVALIEKLIDKSKSLMTDRRKEQAKKNFERNFGKGRENFKKNSILSTNL